MTVRLAISVFAIALGFSTPACKDDEKTTTPDASTIDAPPGLCAGGTVGYLGACTDMAQCGSCECRSFGHSQICTKTCTGDGDCPAPSGGCSSGYCRP